MVFFSLCTFFIIIRHLAFIVSRNWAIIRLSKSAVLGFDSFETTIFKYTRVIEIASFSTRADGHSGFFFFKNLVGTRR